MNAEENRFYRVQQTIISPEPTATIELTASPFTCFELLRPVVSYEERLFHNARENLRAFRETLRQKDILFGSFYAVIVTALVLIVCFSL